jgi:chromosome segregation ATPase
VLLAQAQEAASAWSARADALTAKFADAESALHAAHERASALQDDKAQLAVAVRDGASQLEERTRAAQDATRRVHQLDAELAALSLVSVRAP